MDEHGDVRVPNCTRLFKFLCPKKWENLQPTAHEDIRFCHSCKKNVILCTTYADLSKHSGHCVALIDTEDKVYLREHPTIHRYRVGEPRLPGPYDDYIPLQDANKVIADYPEWWRAEMEANQEEG